MWKPTVGCAVFAILCMQDIAYADCHIKEQLPIARLKLKESSSLRFKESMITSRKLVTVRRKGKRKKVYRSIRHMGLSRQETALAILNRDTCEITIARYWLTAEDIEKGNDIRREYAENPDNLPRYTAVDEESSKFEVTVNWWNQFNSNLSINAGYDTADAGRYIVLANKFLVRNSQLAYESDRTGDDYSDIVYTPYSQALHVPELITSGKNYLNQYVKQAFDELREAEVESRSFPGALVTDTIDEDFPKHIFVNEQSDPRWMLSARDGGRWVAERYLVLLGANEGGSFRYTYSKTGALGIAQIMPGTYAHIVKTYPEAKLNKNIDAGRVEPLNAIKTAILVFDDHFAEVIRRISTSRRNRTRYLAIFESKSDDEYDEIRAAIYNGGPGKYVPGTGEIGLRVQETVDFVRKFRLIRALRLFE